jgi:type IV pilus assembly protein PilV
MKLIDSKSQDRHRGFTLIEVLVTVLIIAIGLLGLAGLQMSSLNNQLEAYQRAQALLMVEEMAHRIRANGAAARDGEYPDGDQYGLLTPQNCAALDPNTPLSDRDLCQWNNAVAGTGVQLSGSNFGSAIGARGCLEEVPGSADGELIIRVSMAWQGLSPTVESTSDCGRGAFGDDDRLRRVISVDAVVADLAL